MKRYIGFLAFLAALVAVPAGSNAARSDSAPNLVITDVDTTRYPDVDVYLAAPDGQLPDPHIITLKEDGQTVTSKASQKRDVGVSIAVAISLRRSMRGQGLPGSPSRLADARAVAGEIATMLTSHTDLMSILGFHKQIVPIMATQVLTDGGGLRNRLYNTPPEQLAGFGPQPFSLDDSRAYAALSNAVVSATRALSPTLHTAQSDTPHDEVDLAMRRQLKAIVVIADSCDDLDQQYKLPGAQSCVVPDEVRQTLAAQADTLTVFTVGVGSDTRPQIKPNPPDEGYGYVANYALLKQYGGEHFDHLSKAEELQLPALREWIATRRNQIIVTYRSNVNGGRHEITAENGTRAVGFSEPRIPPKVALDFDKATHSFNITVEYKQVPIVAASYYRDGALIREVNAEPFAMPLHELQLSQTATITASVTDSDNAIFIVPGKAEIPALVSSSAIPKDQAPASSLPWPLYAAFALMLATLVAIGILWWSRRRSGLPLPSTEPLPAQIIEAAYALATLPQRDKIYPLQPGRTIIGSRKDKTDVTLALPGIAEQHADLAIRSDGQINVIDQSGSGETFINNIRLTPGKPAVLRAGDLLTLGALTLKCIRWRPADQASPEATTVDAPAAADLAAQEVGA